MESRRYNNGLTQQHFSLSHYIKAMFGFLPAGVDDSLTNLIIYNASPVEVKFNNGVIKSTWDNISNYFINWIKGIFILGMYCSLLLAYNYQPYPNTEGPSLLDINILTGFTPQQMINNASVASECSDNIFCCCFCLISFVVSSPSVSPVQSFFRYI